MVLEDYGPGGLLLSERTMVLEDYGPGELLLSERTMVLEDYCCPRGLWSWRTTVLEDYGTGGPWSWRTIVLQILDVSTTHLIQMNGSPFKSETRSFNSEGTEGSRKHLRHAGP